MQLRFRAAALLALAAFLPAQQPPTPPENPDQLPDLTEKLKGYTDNAGYFRVHQKKQSLLLEIPRVALGKPFLLATSFSGGTSFAGWQWSDMLLQWERLDNKLLLIEKNTRYRADQGNPVFEVVGRTYSDRVVKAMDILAESRTGDPSRGLLVSGTDLFAANAGLFFGGIAGMLDPSLTKVAKLKAFEQNVEIALAMPQRGNGQFVTIHYSIRSLPETGYKPREADDRIGYFLTTVKDFSKAGSGDRFQRYINRWNIEKLDPKLKVSPPKRPIEFYIEKTVPVAYRRFVAEAILEWNRAFEKVGIVGAIVVHQQTADNEFAGKDPEDARWNFFRWIVSETPFAMGPSRVNPMTGEILDADIIFDDSMMRWSLREYEQMVRKEAARRFSPRTRQAFLEDRPEHPLSRLFRAYPEEPAFAHGIPGLLGDDRMRHTCSLGEGVAHQVGMLHLAALAEVLQDSKKKEDKKDEWPEEYLGMILKETVMHEVGHTLGLRHNFAGSTLLSLEEINSAGKPPVTTASVMDYNPVNIAVGKETQGEYIERTLGPYDYWAIEYGYKPTDDKKELETIAKRGAEKGLHYATDEDCDSNDPYVSRFDLSSDPLTFTRQRLDLVTALMPKLVDRVVAPGESHYRVREALNMLFYETVRVGVLAARFVGGESYHRDHKGDPNARPPVVVTPAARQREALKILCDRYLTRGALGMDPKLLQFLGARRWSHWGENPGEPSFPIQDEILAMQELMLWIVLEPDRLTRVADQALKVEAGSEPFTVAEVFDTLTRAIFSELDQKPQAPFDAARPFIDTIHRNLQRAWVSELIDRVTSRWSFGPQITRAIAYSQLEVLKAKLATAYATPNLDRESMAHMVECATRAEKALQAAYQIR